MHFFDIWTSKQKLKTSSFWHFWHPNVFCATTACTFSTSERAKVVRCWRALYILTWKCASRHNGVQFFISHLARWLRTAALGSLLFDPPEPQATNHSESRLSYLFAHLHLLSSLSVSSLIFTLLFFSSLTLPTSAFTSVHIVGSLTSKLPSIMCTYIYIYIYTHIYIYT